MQICPDPIILFIEKSPDSVERSLTLCYRTSYSSVDNNFSECIELHFRNKVKKVKG